MAKQTFTTGQVLTAAQMTSLQQTAMGGGAATAKTASYVLVAADAGTTVAMNAAGATTITVNTGLFAAGDTVFIQNLGAGACTVTAGTATVATAGSLILPQNDAGILYFTSASAAIFYDYIQAGAVSPLTTKGDLYTFSTSDARLGVGANNTVLTADSSEATGLKWAAPASGGGLTLLGTTTLSSTSTTISITPTGYVGLLFLVSGVTVSAAGADIIFKPNNEAALTNWNKLHQYATSCDVEFAQNSRYATGSPATTGGANAYMYQIYNVDTAAFKPIEFSAVYLDDSSRQASENGGGGFRSTSTITSMVIATANGATFNAGTVLTYGVK